MTAIWAKKGSIPSGWGHVEPPGVAMRAAHYFYRKLQYTGAFTPASARQRALQADGHKFIGEAKRQLENGGPR